MEDYLIHYGILGMKWGIRRFQNADGTLTPEGKKRYAESNQKQSNKIANKANSREQFLKERTIPAGTKIYRTTSIRDENKNGEPIYVSYLDVDRNHYNGGWIRKTGKTGKAFEQTYELKQDLKIPSRETYQKAINDVVLQNKKYISDSVEAWVKQVFPENTWRYWELEEYYDGGVKKYIDDMITNLGKMSVSEASYVVAQSLGLCKNVKNEIIKNLKDQGYNAMVDEASVGGQSSWLKEGVDPLIVFDSNALTRTSVREISGYEESKYHKKDVKWQSKANSARNKSAAWSDF